MIRVGLGYDIHRLVEGRKLILGGVEIPHTKGLDGHSDADCLTHALADAILGAMGLPDIGYYFPPGDPQCKDIDSQLILAKAVSEAKEKGYQVNNVDIMVIAEAPKIGPHLNKMKAILSKTLHIDPSAIGIKATTNEKIGDIGRGTGIATHAICSLVQI